MISTSVSKLKGNLGETQPPLCKYIYIYLYIAVLIKTAL